MSSIANQNRILSERIRNSDHAAFETLVQTMERPLFMYAWSILKNEDACYDVLQDVFMKVWTSRKRIDPRKSLKAFVYTITRNKSLNYLRDTKYERQSEDAEMSSISMTTPDALDNTEAKDLGILLETMIEQLPDRRREVLKLSRYQGLSHAEIAEVLGISTRTVNNHLVLALQDLRTKLIASEALPDHVTL